MVSILEAKIPGYSIHEKIYSGSRTLVYRGIREHDQQPVVIKMMRLEYPSFNELLQFRNQYVIAKNIKTTGVIRIYSLESYNNGYALVMEDFGGISLKEWGIEQRHTQIIANFLQVAIAIADILSQLHQERIIHKDIKPANILIHPDTKQVKIIDFSIASLLPREVQVIQNLNILEGTLAYMSPEQTGRMNRCIDYRSDFYSLGITFYELLTGQLPFYGDDAMELLHCHIAQEPKLVHEINPDIPSVISEIVSKLMAKNAEARYQSSLGLKYDLENCLNQLEKNGKINDFVIAQQDVCDRFIIPEKLYGREQEVQTLLAAFDRVANGATEIMLIAGFSGIGKTMLVNEVHKPIVRQRGYFIKGKFDQFNRDTPFSAFVQAFRNLMRQLLTESDQQIQTWKTQILKALGEDGQVIIDVIPELSNIIGQQPLATELSGIAVENRFNLLFQKFVQVFTTKEHPLVIFLDDLQWADSASLKLIQLLMCDSHPGCLLFIGAYRDNEVSPVHPLMITLKAISELKSVVNTITLTPLNQFHLNQLVADTLKCQEELAFSLSELIARKTDGNPFFITQFLNSLYQDELIEFNYVEGYWQCDISRINQHSLTANVVDFMVMQLQKLPKATQQILQIAACIGNEFNLQTLAIVCQLPEVAVADDLWIALQADLILPQSEVYKFYQGENHDKLKLDSENPGKHIAKYRFLHDRVQQAAYSLIADDQKQSTHLKIGQLLLTNASTDEREENIFTIVNLLNIGRSLLTQEAEINQLLQLNLTVAHKAKLSTAYSASMQYIEICLELLPADSWQSQTNLTRSIYELAVEVAYLNTNYNRMEELAAIFLAHTDNLIEKVRVYEIKMLAARGRSQFLDSIQIGLQLLQLLGIEFPPEPTPGDIGLALQQTFQLWQGREIDSLLNAPIMTDPFKLAAMKILSQIVPSAYQALPQIMPLLIFKQIELSIVEGNCEISAFSYAEYGLVLCGIVGDLNAGYQFGQLALKLLDRFHLKTAKCRTYFIVHSYTSHWQESLSSRLPLFQEGYQAGLETGDLESSALNAVIYAVYAYFAGHELSTLAVEMEHYRQNILQLKQAASLNYHNIYHQTVLNLLGLADDPCQLIGSVYDEAISLPILQQVNNVSGIYYLYYNKTFLCYLLEQYQQAADYAKLTDSYANSIVGMFVIPLFCFYSSLIDLALFVSMSATEQTHTSETVAINLQKLKHWADHAPMNHLHKFYLVTAEHHRVLGNKIAAIEYYDLAILGAKENGYIQEEALANELCAKFYLNWGKDKVAASYMQEAYYCYARWGAKVKTDHLEQVYPQLLKPILQQTRINFNSVETIGLHGAVSIYTSTRSSTSISEVLDFTSALKAAQAISSSLELDTLISSLTQIILENSGAKKSVLILPEAGHWQVRAITLLQDEGIQTILETEPLVSCTDIPAKIINYVKNTQQTVVMDDCVTDIPGIIGEYMHRIQPKSVLCTPIIHQGHLVGILYLENQLTSGVFNSDRLQVVQMLSAQAAISLENSRLFRESQAQATQLEQTLQQLQQTQLQLIQNEKMSALGNLVAGVAHEMNNPLGFIYASLQQAKPTLADITKHLQLYQKALPNPEAEILDHAEEIDIDYILADLPKVIDSMALACDRLKNISTSLRTFSRTDQEHKVLFNLHEGIDSTILILKHRLKANQQRPAIEVTTNYGNLPLLNCFPGQLNQVFMNIIANAIDALEESNTAQSFAEIQAHPNKITITTSVENQFVKILIADNGHGMSETVKHKIFDHLFTTKGVGKGTGLGLAIAKQIVVEKHGGIIDVDSIPGEMTEFMILLPL